MKRRAVLPALLLICLALFSGCRTRTAPGSGTLPGENAAPAAAHTAGQESGASSEAGTSAEENGEAEGEIREGEAGGRTRENPEAPRREFDENAAAEIEEGTNRLLHERGEGPGAPEENPEAAEQNVRMNDLAEMPAVRKEAAETAEQKGTSEEAKEAESALAYYTVLLQERTGSLFECKRLNAYWETAEDHVTIHKSSPEHALILQAGMYDVSARLLEENLRVDDGWVVRKNPGMIIKIVDSGVPDDITETAENVRAQIRSREGWQGLDAEKNNKVVLLSRKLLETPGLRTAAALIAAKAAYPDLFADVDPGEALRQLAEEETGTVPGGAWYNLEENGR